MDLINSNKDIIDKNKRCVYLLTVQSNSNKTLIDENIGDISNNRNNIYIIEENITYMNLNIDKIPTIENNITKNYVVSQLNKEKVKLNLKLIDNHANNMKMINSAITDIKNDISNSYIPITNPKYILDNIYLYNLDFEKKL